jgi:hypothetical protein
MLVVSADFEPRFTTEVTEDTENYPCQSVSPYCLRTLRTLRGEPPSLSLPIRSGPEPEAPKPRTPQLNGSARFTHLSRSFSFLLSGVPGWMIPAGQRSAAMTISRNVPAFASAM